MSTRRASDSGLTGKKYNDASAGGAKVNDIVDPPTIGAVTDPGVSGSAQVAFTAAPTGGLASSFIATSNPSSITGSSTTTPVLVQGLTDGTSYTFTVKGVNSTTNNSPSSNATNSYTPFDYGYTLAATYNTSSTHTVGALKTKVAVYVMAGGSAGGAGGGSTGNQGGPGGGGGAGGLSAAVKDIAVTAGQTVSVTVGGVGGVSSFGTLVNSAGTGNATGIVVGNGTNTGGTAGNANAFNNNDVSTQGNAGGAGAAGGNIVLSGTGLTSYSYGGGGGGGSGGSNGQGMGQAAGRAGGAGGGKGGAGGAGGDGNNNQANAGVAGTGGTVPGGGGGGGGGGGRNNNTPVSTGGGNGGAGTAGRIYVYEG